MARNPFNLPGLSGVSGMQSKLPSDVGIAKPTMVRPEQNVNPEARAMRFRRLQSILGRPRGTGVAAVPTAPMTQPMNLAAPLAPPPGLKLKK